MLRDPEYRRFVLKSAFRGVVYFGIIVGLFFIFKYWVPSNWKVLLAPVTSKPLLMFLIFFLSETFFGIIPPEFFIIWSSGNFPLEIYSFQVALMSVLSFLGALIAYWAGTKLHHGGLYNKIMKGRMKKYVYYYQRFGGAIIVISAVTPLPFAAISLISATLGFRFPKYCLYASTRFLRFIFYGFFFWGIQ